MASSIEPFLVQAVQVVELIGKIDEFPHSLVVKCSDNVSARLKRNLDNSIRGDQHLKFTRNRCMLVEGSELDVELHKKHLKLWKKLTREPGSEEGPMPKANIKFDDLQKHLSSRTGENLNFEVKFPIQGLQLWLVIKSHDFDLNTQDKKIKDMVVELNNLHSILHRSASTSDVVWMFIDLGTAISKLNPVAHAVLSGIQVIYNHLGTQKKSYEAVKSLANSIQALSGQLSKLKEVPISDEMRCTIREFPVIMEEVVDFIRRWLKSWMFKYIFVESQKEKAIEIGERLIEFKDKFDRDLLTEIYIAQIEKKELDDLKHALMGDKLSLRDPCMPGTRNDILTMIEREVKRVDGPSVIWIRGFPGVGKSALAASIAIRLREQHRHVICFRFDRTQSTTITTDALWRAIAYDLARLHPSLRKHLTQGSRELISSDMDQLFKLLIETPLSLLKNVPLEELPVIVIDALDECGGLRHDSSEKRDHTALLRTLQRWVKVDYLKRFKLVITSRKENRITKIFPEPISVHVNIPSGNDVKPGDSASEDIRIFLKSRLEDMGLKVALIEKALESLVPRAAGLFIWVTTVANFLELDPEGRFAMLENDDGKGLKGLDSLYSLYSTIVKASFGHGLVEEEIRAVVSVIGAMIYAKEPLDDNALIMLPKVKIPGLGVDRLGLIRQGLMSVIYSGPVLRFHHRSFEDFLLSSSFLQQHPELSDVQDRVYHERQLAVLCLKTLVSSKLHFNMCSLESSIVKNVDIQASVRSAIPPLVSYSCQYWADHLAHAPSDKTLMEAVKFLMHEKLLFWIEAMSLLGKAYEVALILRRALSWKTLDPDHEVTLFIRDALRFIPAFIIPISQCPPHIYVSALSFAPKQSLVAKKFCSRFPNTVVVIEGRPSQWPMVVFTAEHHKNHVRRLVFSPNERTFASISTLNDICVCDSETGHCISGPFELRYDESVYDAYFSPDGSHILLEFNTYAVVLDIEIGEEQFRIEGRDFAFIQDGRRIASTHWIDEDGNSISWGNLEYEGVWPTRIVVKLWDARNGALISDRLFEVNDVAHTRFSPDGRFLAVGRKSESVIELWNLEDGKDPRRFSYPPGDLSSFVFSPTSDSFMVVSGKKNIYLWRPDEQEMIPFSHDFGRSSHVIHSPLTNYLCIQQRRTVEIWDISMTGSKLVLETNPPTTSRICGTRPSRDGRRLLVGCYDGSVRMWELDLENLAMSQADTVDTQADADVPQFVVFSHSGKMVATKSKRSDIELLDTTTGEVVLCMNSADDMEIAFSPDENQVAFWPRSLITVCDIMHPDHRVSFDPWPRKDIRIRKVAFQTCNDLVICALYNDSALLQVWHQQDPAGFECTYSLDVKVGKDSYPLLAPDGLTVIIVSESSATKCYSWNHETSQFRPVCFDDQVNVDWPKYSPDGKLFACWSRDDSHVRVRDTRTGQLVSKFRTSEVDAIALSPTLIVHSPSDRLIALWFKSENTIHLLDVYTGHLYAKILGRGNKEMAFIRDGTKLAHYSPNFGSRTWDIAESKHEHRHSAHGCELMPEDMKDGWVVGRDNEPLFWVPVEHRVNLYVSSPRVVLGIPRKNATKVDLSNSRLGRKWTECIDKEWLRELERKGKEIGNVLEK